MGLALRQIKVYGKLGATVVVVAAGLLVALKNLSRTADVWFFRDYRQVPTLWLILVTAVLAVVGWWGIRKVGGVLRDLGGLRQARQAAQQRDEQQQLARELAEREKRIDEKLRRSITNGS
jgi:Sec-independent protein translocase protein TatA